MKLEIIETLKRCELFLGLDDNDIQKIVDLPSCKIKTLQAQEVIIEAGEGAKHLYVLKEGKVNIVLKMMANSPQPPVQTVVRIITKGGIFGWSALVPPHIRVMSAVAEMPSKVISISGNELRTLFGKDPKLGYEVMNDLLKVIGSRVWNIEQLLSTGKRSPFIRRTKPA